MYGILIHDLIENKDLHVFNKVSKERLIELLIEFKADRYQISIWDEDKEQWEEYYKEMI